MRDVCQWCVSVCVEQKVAYGTVVGWLPPEGDDEALWHVVHDDGDEEDLDLKDVSWSLTDDATSH